MSSIFPQEIADYLEDNGIGTVGTDILIGDFSQDSPDGIYLVTVASPAPSNALDTEHHNVDIYCRFSSTSAGYDKLRAVYDLLHRDANFTLTTWYVYLAEARSQIEDLGRDSQDRKLLRLAFHFIARLPTSSNS